METPDLDAQPKSPPTVRPVQISRSTTRSPGDGILQETSEEIAKEESRGKETQSATPSEGLPRRGDEGEKMTLGDRATAERSRPRRGERSSPDGFSACQRDNGVRARKVPVDVPGIRAAIANSLITPRPPMPPRPPRPLRGCDTCPQGSPRAAGFCEEGSPDRGLNPLPTSPIEKIQPSHGESQAIGRIASVDRPPPHYQSIVNHSPEDDTNCNWFAGEHFFLFCILFCLGGF